MDLSSMKENINKYETVEEVLSDLRQIWENCRLFNAEGSDISATANMMDMELEGLVEVRTSLQNFYIHHICSSGNITTFCIEETAVLPYLS